MDPTSIATPLSTTEVKMVMTSTSPSTSSSTTESEAVEGKNLDKMSLNYDVLEKLLVVKKVK